MISALLAVSSLSVMCQGLPEAPASDVNLRLEMAGDQMEKAGRARLHGALLMVAGGAVAAIATADKDNPDLPIYIAGGAALGFVGFSVKGALHDGKAGRHLNRRK